MNPKRRSGPDEHYTLHWNQLHIQSREVVCELCGFRLSAARQKWHEIEFRIQKDIEGFFRARGALVEA